jgi:hypothetical protein
MMVSILVLLLCFGVLGTVNGCYVDPAPYGVASDGRSGMGTYQGEPYQRMEQEEERQFWSLWRQQEREREQERADEKRAAQEWEPQREPPYDWMR